MQVVSENTFKTKFKKQDKIKKKTHYQNSSKIQ